jgi:hypothetical protein
VFDPDAIILSYSGGNMKYLAIAWNVLLALIYAAVVIGILSVAESRFETLVLAGLIQLYAAVLYNFSLQGAAADSYNLAEFVRFRFLAAALGVTENEEGTYIEQEKAIADEIMSYGPKVLITRISHGVVSAYALFKIVQAIL